jgi:FemAB-related protein (PEP-CTERM system-associated)
MRVGMVDNRGEWNSLVEDSGGPVFALWEWAEACELYGHQWSCLGAWRGDELVAGVPLVHMRSRAFDDQLVSMPFSEHGSVVSRDDDEATSALLDRVREVADRLDVDFVSLRGRDLGDPPGYQRRNRFLTFRIPVGDGPDAVWDGLSSSRRGHVRQARENDLELAEADSLTDLREYFDLYVESVRGHGSPPHAFEFYERLWRGLGDRMRVLLVRKDGHLVNGIIDFPFGDRVFHWGSVADYEYRDLDGGSLLLWEGLEWSAENRYETYDLGRTREGSGVYSFKKSFGGEKVWYNDYHYFPDGEVTLPNPDDGKYDRFKQVWRRLPMPVVRTLGPPIRGKISL